MWKDLLKAINDKDQDKALQIINTMTPDNFDRDYSKLTTSASPINLAADFGLIKIIDAVLYKCPKLANTADTYGKTPLHYAVYNGDLAVVKALIEASASVDATNTDGQTPLHYAAFHGNLAVGKALIEAGASVNATDKNGNTPLHQAAFYGNLAVGKALIEAGASIDATDTYGKTPLHHAAFHASSGNLAIVKALVEAGASVNATDENGNTPLHEVIYHNRQEELVKLLIKAGANPDATNKNGYTILHSLLSINIPLGKRVIDIAPNETTDLIVVKLLEDASAIHKIIASPPALDQQKVKIEDKVEIKNLDLLGSILNHNFQLHNKAYKSKAELKHVFDYIKPTNVQQQVELDKIKIQFNKIIEDGIDYADRSKIADLKYLAAVSPLAQAWKIISDKDKQDNQKEQALEKLLLSYYKVFDYKASFDRDSNTIELTNIVIEEEYTNYIDQVLKLNSKTINQISANYPEVAKDLVNILTSACTDEQNEKYQKLLYAEIYEMNKNNNNSENQVEDTSSQIPCQEDAQVQMNGQESLTTDYSMEMVD